jgi:Fe-S cluster assembly protein SufD
LSEIATRTPARETRAAGNSTGGERTVSTRAPASIEVFREDFARLPAAPAWLQRLREDGLGRFEALGFPTTKNEDWHFTSVAPIAERGFRLAGAGAEGKAEEGRIAPEERTDRREASRRKADTANSIGARAADVARFGFGETSWHTLVFLNGVFSEDLSSWLDQSVLAGSLAHAVEAGNPVLESHIGKVAKFDQHTFTALNTAFIGDGAVIEVPSETVVEQPIHLLFISDGEGVSHPRNLIVAGRHSRATVIESYVSLRDGAYFTNAVTEIVVGEGAHVDHYKLQRESGKAFHVGTVQARQERDSQLHSFSLAVGGSLARTNIYTSLDGDAATCTLNGLYLTDGAQHIDNQTSIEHIAPNCPSHEVYKGVLDGRSHGVFNGKVYVHPEAQKTDGKQSNNNLLLSPHARVDTKPQLEIFADDVKCTHGATVGRLDEVAMFYLNSRGIGPESARTLLTYAFAADVLETIELEPLRKQLEKMVLVRFAGDVAE